jgi:DNA-binding CsgD family transcriptional regulator
VAAWGFVGRTTELNRLVHAATGLTDRGLIFTGDAGVGKTRLLREALGLIDAGRYAVWSASANAATAGLPFGGLSQVLPADQPGGTSPGALLRWAIEALRRQAGGRPIVFAIDDAHLLDPLSAALLYLVAGIPGARIVGTMRAGEPIPDPLSALWRDDLAELADLEAMSEQGTGDLLAGLLGGAADESTVSRLHDLSQGNALMLRELVAAGRSTGEISQSYGLWRWTGEVRLPPSLTTLIDARIGQLSPDVQNVLELVALGEPIGLALLARAGTPAAIETAEERVLIRVVREERRTSVRLAHPLYGEVVRGRCPVSRTHRLQAHLAELVEQVGCRRREDLMRVALWRLASDTAHDPRVLLEAARRAFASFDVRLAVRLAAAARTIGGGFDAAELLGTLLMFAGAPGEAIEVLEAARAEAASPDEYARWCVVHALTSYWGLLREGAADLLAETAATIDGAARRTRLAAFETMMRLHHLELAEAQRLAGAVLADPEAAAGSRALVTSALAHVAALHGRTAQTAKLVAEIEAGAAAWRDDTPYFQLALELARGCGLVLGADLAGVDAIATAEYADLAADGDFQLGTGYLAIMRGQASRLRGRLVEALRRQQQACNALGSGQIFTSLAHAERAHAAALAGDAEEAVEAMAAADAVNAPTMAVLYPWLEHARCWVLACSGDVRAAVEATRRLAERLRRDAFHGHELYARHDLVRLGQPDEAAERLDELVALVDGPLPPVLAAHARAAAGADPVALLEVARTFSELGLALYGAEAATSALNLLLSTRSQLVRVATDLLDVLLQQCERPRTPALELTVRELSERELQIAKHAAAGVSSKEIGERLFLSSRTVDNHLRRVYAKLGISGRGQLPAALRALTERR